MPDEPKPHASVHTPKPARRPAGRWIAIPGGFAAGGLAIFMLLWMASERLAPVYPGMRADWVAFQRDAGRAEALYVGNSHSRALDPRSLRMNAVPLWRAGGDAFESGLLARTAAARMPRLRTVFISASYHLLTFDNGTPLEQGDRSQRRRELYARVPVVRPLTGDARHFVAGKVSPVVRPDHWKDALLAAVRGRGHAAQRTRTRRPLPRAELAAHARLRVEAGLRQSRQVEARRPDVRGRAVDALEESVQALTARGVTVVLYTPPYHAEYTRLYDRADADGMRAAMRGLAARVPGVHYYDFSTDPALVRPAAHFSDSDHLSAAGARAFSLRLREAMADDGILRR
jgi:hypothetical protein